MIEADESAEDRGADGEAGNPRCTRECIEGVSKSSDAREIAPNRGEQSRFSGVRFRQEAKSPSYGLKTETRRRRKRRGDAEIGESSGTTTTPSVLSEPVLAQMTVHSARSDDASTA